MIPHRTARVAVDPAAGRDHRDPVAVWQLITWQLLRILGDGPDREAPVQSFRGVVAGTILPAAERRHHGRIGNDSPRVHALR
jgi:hypothetical protein